MDDLSGFSPLIGLFLWVVLSYENWGIFALKARTKPCAIFVFADLTDPQLFCELWWVQKFSNWNSKGMLKIDDFIILRFQS